VPLLRAAGHDAIAVDLPGDDESAGLPEYAHRIETAARDRGEVTLVAQSLGAFSAAVVAPKLPLSSLILVNAMLPLPGETAGQWWSNTDAIEAREAAAQAAGYGPFDVTTYFLHDVPPDVAEAGESEQRPEADAVFESVCDFPGWPPVPIRVLVGADDRFFPAEFQCTLARERLGVEADLLPGGHLIALAQPEAVAAYLLRR
jgi:pimeloyl-ACP methyl ester carboxylesterase